MTDIVSDLDFSIYVHKYSLSKSVKQVQQIITF